MKIYINKYTHTHTHTHNRHTHILTHTIYFECFSLLDPPL